MEDRLHDETALDSLSMSKLQCDPKQLPQHLYRVQYPSCNTTLNEEGLYASDPDPISEDDIAAFRQSVVDFSTWNKNHKTPYISLFSKREAAEDFALKKSGEIKLITIDTFRLPRSVQVFKLSTLIKTFGIKPVGTAQQSDGIYLCLYHIPTKAIHETKARDQIELDHFIEQYLSHRTQGYEEQKCEPKVMIARSASVDGRRPSLRHKFSVRRGVGQKLGTKLSIRTVKTEESKAEAVDSRCMVSPGGCSETHHVG